MQQAFMTIKQGEIRQVSFMKPPVVEKKKKAGVGGEKREHHYSLGTNQLFSSLIAYQR